MTILLDTVTLPASLTWTDRDDWQPVRQTVRQTLDGGLALYHAPAPAGRPITLKSSEIQGWIDRATLDALQALASVPGSVHTLTIGAETFTVVWRHQDPPALSATPLVARATHAAGDFFQAELRFTAL